MPRSGSGTYTLPSGNPVVTGTTIESNWANTTLSDIATTLTDSLSRSGQGGMTAALRIADGTQGAPGLGFANETGSGFYRAGTAEVWAVVQGAQTLNLDASGVTVPADKATSIEGTFVFNETGADKDARFEGDTDANLLFTDASTDRVGVGTATPAAKLDVNGTAAISGNVTLSGGTANGVLYLDGSKVATSGSALVFDGSNLGLGVTPSAWSTGGRAIELSTGGLLAFPSTGSLNLANNAYFNNSSQWIYLTTAAASRYFQNAGVHAWHNAPSGTAGNAITFTQAMTLDASGNLGIGTSSPASKLHVSNTAAATRITITDDVANGRSGYIESNFSDALVIGTTSGVRGIRFSPDNTARMFLDSSGNLGIGTSSPGYKLDVQNSISTAYSASAASTPIARVYNTYGSAGNTMAMVSYGDANYSSAWYVGLVENGGGAYTGDFVWQNRTGASTYAEALRLNSSGNLGLGVTPGVKLDIGSGTLRIKNATGDASGLLILQDTSDTAKIINYYNGPLVFGTNNTERARITSAGELCIGTTGANGSARLNVTGVGSTSATYITYFSNSSGTRCFAIEGDGRMYTGTAATSPYNNTTASAANMVVDSAGILLRSTSSLKYKTDVQDATHGLAEVMQLRPVTYKGKKDGDTVFGGLIAEEVHAAGLTEFVQYAEDGSPDALAYGNMVSLLTKAIQEQQAIINDLRARVAALEAA